MEFKNAVEAQYHFDEEPEVDPKAIYAAEAAYKLNEVFAWLVGQERGHPESKRKAQLARLQTLRVVLGKCTQQEAANAAGVVKETIAKHKADFCRTFGIEKRYNQPIREK